MNLKDLFKRRKSKPTSPPEPLQPPSPPLQPPQLQRLQPRSPLTQGPRRSPPPAPSLQPGKPSSPPSQSQGSSPSPPPLQSRRSAPPRQPLHSPPPPPLLPSGWRPLTLIGDQICPVCKNRRVTLNQNYNYCSNACATKALSACEQCKLRPKFKDVNKVHPYCSRTCAKNARNARSKQVNPLPKPPTTGNVNLAPQKTPSVRQAPKCTLPVSADEELGGERSCISCRLAPMNEMSVLCQPCHDDALGKAPLIIEVSKDHESYRSVESQFRRAWRHNTTCPEIKIIYKIITTEASMKQYRQYLHSVEARGGFLAMGMSPGNENRRWHGTKRKCYLGDPGHTTLCAEAGCSLCCIIKASFDIKLFKLATGWGRFGHGIYTSSTSSKSNDYSKNVGINSELKALLLNRVVVGNGKKLIKTNASLTAPPPGFDSIIGEAATGGSLNYDELVVYHNDAVRPSYLVMYKSP